MEQAMRRGVLRSSFLPALLLSVGLSQSSWAASLQPNDSDTLTPIKHVIVIIGENRTFDHVFGAYAPRPGQSVFNLLSQGIILPDGSPGPNFARAAQASAEVTSSYDIAPSHKQPYATLPPAMTDGAPQAASDGDSLPFLTLAHAAALDGGVLPSDLRLLLTGATGLPRHSIDKRMPNAMSLPNGPYQLTPSIAYDDFGPSPRSPLLSDVAAAGLQRWPCQRRQSQRLPERPLPLGRGHRRRREQRQAPAQRIRSADHGRRLDRHGLLQRQ
ncbi:MAG TPA: alkaline phosphatase family protein [Dongiaceae bacterium]|nr:alkaline phosphatase family protein [Dongiaceae bacterium]